jgi:NitT/TauT family transport system substrate-binding protein
LPNWPVSFGIVRRDFGEKNAEVLKKYREAWNESVRWIRANPDAAKAIMQKFAGVPPEVAKRIILPDWSEDIGTTRKTTEEVMKAMVAAGMIPKAVDLSKVIAEDVGAIGR